MRLDLREVLLHLYRSILDSGANICIVNDTSWFEDFRALSYNVGTADDSEALHIAGAGTVKLTFHDDSTLDEAIELTLTNVAYALTARYNILSML